MPCHVQLTLSPGYQISNNRSRAEAEGSGPSRLVNRGGRAVCRGYVGYFVGPYVGTMSNYSSEWNNGVYTEGQAKGKVTYVMQVMWHVGMRKDKGQEQTEEAGDEFTQPHPPALIAGPPPPAGSSPPASSLSPLSPAATSRGVRGGPWTWPP